MSFDFSSQPTRKLVGLQIFQAGSQTDSLGREKVWSPKDLDNIKRLFDAGSPEVVYIKLGHCSPEHVTRLSQDLEIPNSILLGEDGTGRGAAALGKVTEVFRHNDSLVANVEVPEKIANFINSGFLTGVSCEIIGDYKGQGAALSALALLGAERPAIKNLVPLTQTAMLDEGTPVYAYDDKFNFISLPFGRKKTPLKAEPLHPSASKLSPGITKSGTRVKLIHKSPDGHHTYVVIYNGRRHNIVARSGNQAVALVSKISDVPRPSAGTRLYSSKFALMPFGFRPKWKAEKTGENQYRVSFGNKVAGVVHATSSSEAISKGRKLIAHRVTLLKAKKQFEKKGYKKVQINPQSWNKQFSSFSAAALSVKLITKNAGGLSTYTVKIGKKVYTVAAETAKAAVEKVRANRRALQLSGIAAAGSASAAGEHATRKGLERRGYSEMDYAISYSTAYDSTYSEQSDFVGGYGRAAVGLLAASGAVAAKGASVAAKAASVKLLGKVGQLGRYLVKLGSKAVTVVASSSKAALSKARQMIGNVKGGVAEAKVAGKARKAGYDRNTSIALGKAARAGRLRA